MSGLPGSQTVYILKQALVSPDIPKWHFSGKTKQGSHSEVLLTGCGQCIASWPVTGQPPTWHAVAIRRLFAGTFAIPCGTCQRAEAAQKRGRS